MHLSASKRLKVLSSRVRELALARPAQESKIDTKRVCFEDANEQVFEGNVCAGYRCDDRCGNSADRRSRVHGKQRRLWHFNRMAEREIGFWNLAVLIILVTSCFHYDWVYLRAILLALILGGIGIGTNHFIHFLSAHESVNLVGAIENYILAVGWIIGWKFECNRRKTAGVTE